MDNLNDKFLNKSCKVIHKMVVDKWNTLPLSIYPYEEDYGNYYASIFNFIKKTLGFDNLETINQIFYYFIWNYNEEGDYSNTENPNISYTDLLDMFDDRAVILSEHFNLNPFLFEKMDYGNFEMPVFFNWTDDTHYAIGNEREVEDSKRIWSEDRWMNESEVWQVLGVEEYLNYVYVTDLHAEHISFKEASHYELEMDEEEIIDYLRDNMREYEKAKDIVDAYDEVAKKWGELPASANGAPYQMKMSDIADDGRETVRLIIYDYIYDRLDNELIDYLMEMGYITKRNNQFIIHDKELPDWVTFDWEAFHDYDVQHVEIEDLTSYDQYDTFKTKDNIYYYIMRVEY